MTQRGATDLYSIILILTLCYVMLVTIPLKTFIYPSKVDLVQLMRVLALVTKYSFNSIKLKGLIMRLIPC